MKLAIAGVLEGSVKWTGHATVATAGLIGLPGTLPPPSQPGKFSGPGVLRPITDPAFLGEPFGWQFHGIASIQWALNAIETLEFAKPWLRDWETAGTSPSK